MYKKVKSKNQQKCKSKHVKMYPLSQKLVTLRPSKMSRPTFMRFSAPFPRVGQMSRPKISLGPKGWGARKGGGLGGLGMGLVLGKKWELSCWRRSWWGRSGWGPKFRAFTSSPDLFFVFLQFPRLHNRQIWSSLDILGNPGCQRGLLRRSRRASAPETPWHCHFGLFAAAGVAVELNGTVLRLERVVPLLRLS